MKSHSKWDRFIYGVLMSIAVAVCTWGILLLLRDLMEQSIDRADFVRDQTIHLLAICGNILLFQWLTKNRMDEALRGALFTTMLMIAVWIYQYIHLFF